MKKILLICLVLLLLSACSPKREEFYNLTIDGTTVVIGYDNKEVIDNLSINDFETYTDSKENEILDYVEVYVRDLSNNKVVIDDYEITSIKNTCNDLNGEIVTNNGSACVLHKTIKDKENVVILYGDILSDNTDLVNRIEVSYK